MVRGVDIRPLKNELRTRYKEIRRQMIGPVKDRKDIALLKRLFSLECYRKARMVITFVSTEIEVDTVSLIRQAWKERKRVVVPRCITGTRLMEFCEIFSMNDLEPRTFSVLEPKEHCPVIQKYPHSICIVPGLAFDMEGYRLGYGKGYYDRFLSGYQGKTIGVCYTNCLHPALPHGRYDCPVDLLVTDKFCKKIGIENKNGR